MHGDMGRDVWVEYADSEAAAAVIRERLNRAGHRVAGSKAAAAVVYLVEGGYEAVRPATGRSAKISAGVYLERPESFTTRTGRGASAVVSANPVAALIGTIISNLGDRTGARDSMNQATTGDPDGKCLAKCDGWKYAQRAALMVTRREGDSVVCVRASASMVEEELAPKLMLERCAVQLRLSTGLPIAATGAMGAVADVRQ